MTTETTPGSNVILGIMSKSTLGCTGDMKVKYELGKYMASEDRPETTHNVINDTIKHC